MKHTILFSVAFLILTVYSCYFPGESVTGNGNVVTEEREISDVEALKVENGMDVFITQGEEESLRLEVDENLLEHILTEVDGRELKIFSDVNIRMAKSKKIYVTYKNLNSIKISSAGDVNGLNMLNTDRIRIDLSSAGNLNLELTAEETRVQISSSGNVTLSGTTDFLRAELSSAGDLNAFDLEARKADISVSSAGNARVFVTEEGNFEASSAGDIIYKGDPENVNVNTSSAGNVKRR